LTVSIGNQIIAQCIDARLPDDVAVEVKSYAFTEILTIIHSIPSIPFIAVTG